MNFLYRKNHTGCLSSDFMPIYETEVTFDVHDVLVLSVTWLSSHGNCAFPIIVTAFLNASPTDTFPLPSNITSVSSL